MMPIDIKSQHTIGIDQLPTRVLLAESDPVEVDRIRSNIDRKFLAGISTAKNYDDLLNNITKETQLVILGRIDVFNYLEISQGCRKIKVNLPIVLLSKQETIGDSYRQLVKTCGLTDAIPFDAVKLNQLLQQLTIDNIVAQESLDRASKLTTIATRIEPSIERPLEIVATPIIQQQYQIPLTAPPLSGRIMLAALEEIVAVSNNYFGSLAQGNYWRKAHARIVDKFPAIQNWSADHFSKLNCHENILERELTAEDMQSLRAWVQFFIEECERIIVDFRVVLNNSDLSLSAQNLLAKF
jgi:hypothetical protein